MGVPGWGCQGGGERPAAAALARGLLSLPRLVEMLRCTETHPHTHSHSTATKPSPGVEWPGLWLLKGFWVLRITWPT